MRRFAVAVFSSKRDKSAESVASSNTTTSLATLDSLSKKSWKTWFRPSHHKVALPVPHDSSTDETDTDEAHPPPPHLLSLVDASLNPPLFSPPSSFAHPSNAPYAFPRSSNPPNTRPAPHTLRTITLKRCLRHRLVTHPQSQPTSSQSSPLIGPEPPPSHLDPMPSSTTAISLSSPGLTRWISRPCFEDRYAVYLPIQDGSISCQLVSAASFAVADLEFSPGLEAMVEPDTSPILITTPPTPVPEVPPSSVSHSFSLTLPLPSPLRNEHSPPPSPPAPGPKPKSASPLPTATSSDPPVKRGVRFAEEDEKDEVIPLGYVLRQKQKRQEKAQFLKGEADRRALEEEKVKLQEERRRQEVERARLENERKAWEKEKKILEDERKQRMYAEQVSAARIRRENARAGGVPSLKTNNDQPGGLFPTAPTLPFERNSSPSGRRLSGQDALKPSLVPPRREASDPNLPAFARLNPHSIPVPSSSQRGSSDSPGSSRPPSLGTPPTPSSLGPPSTPGGPGYPPHDISSPEDVRAAVAAAMSRTRKRSSYGTHSLNNSSGSLSGDRSASYPMWSGSNPNINNMTPVVPMVPMGYVMMDMPLLPPSAPFMMQQYSRSQGSASGSSRGHLSRESSRERVNGSGGKSSSQSSHGHGHPPRSNSFPEQLHSYKSSGASSSHTHLPPQDDREPKRSSMPVTREKSRQSSQSRPPPATYSYSHSRPQQQPESPWTGIPTQNGKLPNGMAHSKPAQSNLRTSSTRKHIS